MTYVILAEDSPGPEREAAAVGPPIRHPSSYTGW